MSEPAAHDEIARSRERAVKEGRYLLIPADVTDDELEVYAAILNGELPLSAQPRQGPAAAAAAREPRDAPTT